MFWWCFFVGYFIFQYTNGIPVLSKEKNNSEPIVFFDELNQHDYAEYTKEVMNELNNDKQFLEEVDKNSGAQSIDQYAEYLHSASKKARTKLDEIKRREINRLNKLEELLEEKTRSRKDGKSPNDEIYHASRSHISSNNISEFTEEDLKALIGRVTHDINMVDRVEQVQYRRRQYRKRIKERIQLRNTKDPEERKKLQQRFSDSAKRNPIHSKIHDPGSEQQLRDTWMNQDHMDPGSFDSKTFFKLHDLNQDNHWDIFEVEALLQSDVQKVYNDKNEKADFQEQYHEGMRMRQRIMDKMDVNKDQLISFSEFQDFEKTAEFKKDKEWKTADEEYSPMYTQEDWEKYKDELESIVGNNIPSKTIKNGEHIATNVL